MTRSVTRRRGGIPSSFLPPPPPPSLSLSLLPVAIRCAVIPRGWEKRRDLKSQTDGSVWRYRYFAAWSACPASARSRLVLCALSDNPVGYRLAEITKDLGDEPPRRGTTGKPDADAFRKAGPPVGEKARLSITFSRNVSCGIFGGFAASLTKCTQHRRIFRGCADVYLMAITRVMK